MKKFKETAWSAWYALFLTWLRYCPLKIIPLNSRIQWTECALCLYVGYLSDCCEHICYPHFGFLFQVKGEEEKVSCVDMLQLVEDASNKVWWWFQFKRWLHISWGLVGGMWLWKTKIKLGKKK